ncbi:MAG: hypothetical protein RIT45_3590 [Pseudomonadota bacterium]
MRHERAQERRRAGQRWWWQLAGLLLATPAWAQANPVKAPTAATPTTSWMVGVDLRTEVGTHPARIAVGGRRGAFDVVAVVDPMAVTDGQIDSDVHLVWRPSGRAASASWAGLLGWRTTAIGSLGGGHQLQQKLLLGTVAPLPTFFSGRLQPNLGAELAVRVVKHGGGLPTETIGFSSGRAYIDQMQFALWLRFAWHVGIDHGR